MAARWRHGRVAAAGRRRGLTWASCVVVLFVTLTEARAQSASAALSPPSTTNVIYGLHGGLALLMDVYAPTAPANGRGVIVIPGTGFHGMTGYGGRSMRESPVARQLASSLAAAGYRVFIVSHRLAPVFRHPDPLHDVRRAVRFVRTNAAEFGIAPEALGVVGMSSGANLATLLGAAAPHGDAGHSDPVERASSGVQAVAALSTPADLTLPVADPVGAVLLTSYLGAPVFPGRNDAPAIRRLLEEASPTLQIQRSSAPMLLVHGAADTLVPIEQAESLAAALARAGVPHRLLRIPDGTHDELSPRGPREYVPAVIGWLDAHLLRGDAR